MINKKYLPIGTVCSIKNDDKKLVMITGYLPLKYNYRVTVCDYCGVIYPEVSLSDKTVYFNHDDIIDVVFEGYINDLFNNLNNQLNSQSVNNLAVSSDCLFSNIKFDENGVVIFAELNNHTNDNVISKNNNIDVSNPFVSSTYKNKVVDELEEKDWPIFKNIEFDENGIVINSDLDNIENEE